MSVSILQEWVQSLGLRHQGVLVTAIRGCDGMAKEDSTKPIAREMRGLILVPFDQRELSNARGFMVHFPSEEAEKTFEHLRHSLDHYPVHYLFHLIHAIEIIGYYHPNPQARFEYLRRYRALVTKLHLKPESKRALDWRLNEDRIASNTVAQ